MPFFTYILECADGTYYVGCTNNLKKRLKEHNQSKHGAHYTKIRRPVILKYSEKFKTLLAARGREAEIKRWKKGDKAKLWQDIKGKGPRRNLPSPRGLRPRSRRAILRGSGAPADPPVADQGSSEK